MRPLLRNTVELPGPALAPGPAAHNLELNLRLPQSVYISIVRFVPVISKGSRPIVGGPLPNLCRYPAYAATERMGA